jgi:CopG family transcriptional regulator/antitoxin EndoAI
MLTQDAYNEIMKKVTHKRLNITLPESTVTLLETVANKGERSNFINVAIKTYVKQVKQESLRERLKEGAVVRSKRDLELADEWFNIEEELWQK